MKFQIFSILFLILFNTGCSHVKSLNAVEGRLNYEEHYATINDIDYISEEKESFGGAITNKASTKGKTGFTFDYFISPDISFEKSALITSAASLRNTYQEVDMLRVSAFMAIRGVMFTPVGSFEISLGAGASYFEASNDSIDTSKVEPAFRYEGMYSLFFTENIYGAVSFTFQEGTDATFSEYYSLMYRLGFMF